MKIAVLGLDGKKKSTLELPAQFNEPVRPDLIWRAVLALRSKARQRFGVAWSAGKKASAKLSRRRRAYKASYGFGISRTPRKVLSHRGRRFVWTGAVAPQTVGGRVAHPPKPKVWSHKINKKEAAKALRSALSATMQPDLVALRGHALPSGWPFAADSSLEELSKTAQVRAALAAMGFKPELDRCDRRKIRAGKGKRRARPYKCPRGPLIVVSSDCALLRSGRTLPGVAIARMAELNPEILAPGAAPGRLTLFTEAALKVMAKEGLFSR